MRYSVRNHPNMKYTILLPIFFVLQSNAQLLLDFQKVICDNEDIEKTWTFKNHITDPRKKVEISYKNDSDSTVSFIFSHKNYGYELTMLTKQFSGFSTQESLLINGVKIDFPNFSAEEHCSYHIHLVSVSDSCDHFYVGKNISIPLNFSLADFHLSPTDSVVLDELAKTMLRYHFLQFDINVHFDERYPMDESKCLSCERANTTRSYLISKGIDANRMLANGFQGNQPIFKNANSEEQRAMNRRIEIVITHIDQKAKNSFKSKLKKANRKSN